MDFGKLDSKEILISWSMPASGISPKNWHSFHSEAPTHSPHAALEDALQWPHGTIEILDQAFRQRLPRSTGWDLSLLKRKAPFETAAKVFRRGVRFSGAEPKELTGIYPIKIYESERPELALPKDGTRIIDKRLLSLGCLALREGDLAISLNENSKSLASVATIFQHCLKAQGTITIIGGGILADTAAFAANLAHKTFRLVPTTLLAMVDACVGGKTGVNFEEHGKNQLGHFAFPSEVLVDASWLETLPAREWSAGLAEAYKHAFITKDPIFAEAIANFAPATQAILPHLERLIQVKADIISQDPNESGIRAILNFGHTLAHALEKISQEEHHHDPILHGEAIAIGMRFASLLSHELKLLSDKDFLFIERQLTNSLFMPKIDEFRARLGSRQRFFEKLMGGIYQDKKNEGGSDSTEWVLIKGFGEFAMSQSKPTYSVQATDIKKSWERFATQDLNWNF